MTRILWFIVALVLLAPAAQAQTPVVNPTAVTWDHTGWETAVSYDLAYFALPVKADHTCDWTAQPAASAQVANTIPKPATTTGVGMSALLVSRPVGCFVVKMRALDGSGLVSEWSAATDPFAHLPATPGRPVLK